MAYIKLHFHYVVLFFRNEWMTFLTNALKTTTAPEDLPPTPLATPLSQPLDPKICGFLVVLAACYILGATLMAITINMRLIPRDNYTTEKVLLFCFVMLAFVGGCIFMSIQKDLR